MINKTTKTLKVLAFLIMLVGMFALTSASLIYSNNAQYDDTSHDYDIPDSNVGYATVMVRGAGYYQYATLTFNYESGTKYTAPLQNAVYNQWLKMSFINPNTNLKVTSITLTGSPAIYFKDIYVYGDISDKEEDGGDGGVVSCPTDKKRCADGSYVSRNVALNCAFNLCPEEKICGNGKIDLGEQCDEGENNGIKCSADYGSSCTYCSSDCEIITVLGEYCGDGILNTMYERCDDGNRINNDRCTNECKKPFEVIVEDFEPLVWQCDSRVVYDDATEPGRISMHGTPLVERINNYAFEGEQIKWRVLVMDKNGIDKVKDVYITVDGNIEANCRRMNNYQYTPSNNDIDFSGISLFNFGGGSIGLKDKENETQTPEEGTQEENPTPDMIDPSCNARILEEKLTKFNPNTMAYYECVLTVETFESMQGDSEVLIEAIDLDDVVGTMDEVEYWWFNPVIQLSIDGEVEFDEVRPGTSSYSRRVIIGNDAEYGSGVLLDMFISGTDFYDSSSSGAKCPTTNKLDLSNFAYYATNGAYSTKQDMEVGRTCDDEGYCSLNYGTGFNDPFRFYNRNEIIQANNNYGYYFSNILSPGAEMTLIFRLNLPEPCNGDFDTGQIYFWGEAI